MIFFKKAMLIIKQNSTIPKKGQADQAQQSDNQHLNTVRGFFTGPFCNALLIQMPVVILQLPV